MDLHHPLFSSNAPLSAAEIPSVKEEIERRKATIRVLELEVQRYQSLLSPIQSVPAEILGEIFAATLAITRVKPNYIPIDAALVALCLVCKVWRNAALSTPQLWNTAEVHLTAEPGAQIHSHKVRRWLERSEAAPKTVIIDTGSWGHGRFACTLRNAGVAKLLRDGPVISLLIIKSLTAACLNHLVWVLNGNTPDLPSPNPWPMVKHIEVNSSRLDLPIEISISQRSQARYPIVDTLNVDGSFDEGDVEPIFANKHVAILLAGIKNLTVEFHWPSTWEDRFLEAFKNLRNLTLKFTFDESWIVDHQTEDSLEIDEPLIPLPNLRSLRVLGGLQLDKQWYPQFLRVFETPALIELELQFENDDQSFSDRDELRVEIVDLIRRSGCGGSLARLTMHSISVSIEGLKRILDELPALTHLTLDRVAFNSSFFRQPEVVNPPFLPHLHSLELLQLDQSFACSDLHKFVESRVRSADGARLKRVKAELGPRWGKHPNESLDAISLRRAGVDFRFTTVACP